MEEASIEMRPQINIPGTSTEAIEAPKDDHALVKKNGSGAPSSVNAAGTKRKRVCICPICGVQGHYQKSCPQIGQTQNSETWTGAENAVAEGTETDRSKQCLPVAEAPARPPPREKFMNKKAIWVQNFERRNCGKHTPIKLPDLKKRACVICSIRCQYKCEECDIYVHLQCWRKFHDIENPWQQSQEQTTV